MEGTGECIEKWEVDDMMNDGDKNQDGMLDYEGKHLMGIILKLELIEIIIKQKFKNLLI